MDLEDEPKESSLAVAVGPPQTINNATLAQASTVTSQKK